MAAINGISVKAVKKFQGHEGEPLYQGTLYLSGKKIGFWTQDGWGGPDRFDLDGKISEDLLNEAVKKLNPGKVYMGTVKYDLDLLLYDFIVLWQDEKEFKKAVKAGYGGIVVATDGYHVTTWKIPKSYAEMTDEALLKAMEKLIEKAKKSFFKEQDHVKHIVKIYRSFDDFSIGEPIKPEDVMVNR